jgi:hypothetical protein
MSATVTLLAIVKAVNTGKLVWDAVGNLIQDILERTDAGQTPVTMEDVEAAALAAGTDLDVLRQAIEDARNQP